jgi:uncharacterized metal-binding protein
MEKRRLQRTKIHHPGKVYIHSKTAHSCTVHNVTGLGVCIELAFEAEQLPDTLDFSFDNFRTTHCCKVIWRESNLAGVAFERPLMLSDGSRRAKLRVVK